MGPHMHHQQHNPLMHLLTLQHSYPPILEKRGTKLIVVMAEVMITMDIVKGHGEANPTSMLLLSNVLHFTNFSINLSSVSAIT